MRVGMIAETAIESLGARLNLIPQPIIDVQGGLMSARAIMAGMRLGVFEALAGGPLTADALAVNLGFDPGMTRALANSLVGAGYLEPRRKASRWRRAWPSGCWPTRRRRSAT